MKRLDFHLPLVAVLLMILFITGGGFLFGSIGSWLLPAAVTIVKKSWRELRDIPTEMFIIARDPPWLDPDSALFTIVTWGKLIIACTTGSGGIWLGIKGWRHLVVKKFKWLTAEQADEYIKRSSEEF